MHYLPGPARDAVQELGTRLQILVFLFVGKTPCLRRILCKFSHIAVFSPLILDKREEKMG
jgi:hypothetical protein